MLNSSHHMKSFDTKIDYFDGLNRCQQYFLFLPPESNDLSLISRLENNKNELCFKIELRKY